MAENRNDYEKRRWQTINQNNDIMNTLRLKRLATSILGPVRQRGTNKKGKESRADYDEGFIPSNSGDGENDSFDSLGNEVSSVHHHRELPFVDMALQEKTVLPGTQMDPPHGNYVPQSSSVGSTTRRGQTRDIGMEQFFEKNGKLKVDIPTEYRQPVGPFANHFISAVGVEVRQYVRDVSICRWKDVPDSSTVPIVHRLSDKFDIRGDPIDIKKSLDSKMARRFGDWSHKMYTKYKKMKATYGEYYAQSHPPKGCNSRCWKDLIEHWKSEKFQYRSHVNSNN